jgi:hypothetical protein
MSKSPTSPKLGDAYDSEDSITGIKDWTAADQNSRNPGIKLNVYSSISAGAAAMGTKKGTIFALDTGSIVMYKINGTSVSIA